MAYYDFNELYNPAINTLIRVMVANNAAYGKAVVVHEADANVERPTDFASVEWIGSVEPANATNSDTWWRTSA